MQEKEKNLSEIMKQNKENDPDKIQKLNKETKVCINPFTQESL